MALGNAARLSKTGGKYRSFEVHLRRHASIRWLCRWHDVEWLRQRVVTPATLDKIVAYFKAEYGDAYREAVGDSIELCQVADDGLVSL